MEWNPSAEDFKELLTFIPFTPENGVDPKSPEPLMFRTHFPQGWDGPDNSTSGCSAVGSPSSSAYTISQQPESSNIQQEASSTTQHKIQKQPNNSFCGASSKVLRAFLKKIHACEIIEKSRGGFNANMDTEPIYSTCDTTVDIINPPHKSAVAPNALLFPPGLGQRKNSSRSWGLGPIERPPAATTTKMPLIIDRHVSWEEVINYLMEQLPLPHGGVGTMEVAPKEKPAPAVAPESPLRSVPLRVHDALDVIDRVIKSDLLYSGCSRFMVGSLVDYHISRIQKEDKDGLPDVNLPKFTCPPFDDIIGARMLPGEGLVFVLKSTQASQRILASDEAWDKQ